MARHKWNAKSNGRKATGNKGGSVEACLKCGCVREYVSGLITYFLDDNIYHKAPECDERDLLKPAAEEAG